MTDLIASLPPHSVELEEAVIGSILQSQDALLRVIDTLPTDAFFVSLHREIYQSAANLYEAQLTPDLYAIASRFKDEREKIEQIANICGKTVVVDNVESYAAIVLEKYNRRRLIELGHKAIALAHDPITPWDEIVEQIEAGLTDICTGQEKEGLTHISEILNDLAIDLGRPDEINAVPLNIPQVDNMLSGGLRPQTLTIVAGATGLGKSQVLNKIAYEVATQSVIEQLEHDNPVAIFSMEMSKKAIATRFLAAKSQITIGKIASKRLDERDNHDFINALAELSELPIYVDDTPGDSLTLGQIASRCHKIKRKHGSIGMILVDYLQLFGDRASAQRHGEVGKYSLGLRNLAKKLDCRIVALAQINRGPAGRTDKRPTLSDLGESAKIEQDADTVILLYREDYYNKEASYEDEVPLEMIFAKNRNGPCGTATVFFHKPTGRIRGDRPSPDYF